MKVVIIEGIDNTGKTTVIHELMNRYDRVYYMHATKPDETDPVKCAIEQKKYFHTMVEDIRRVEQSNLNVDLVILDRSWIGEYVYGCLYRGNGDDFVKSMISNCYSLLRNAGTGFFPLNFSTILYTASPEFCASNDDGESISEGNVDAIKKEVDRFEEIMESDCVIGKKGIINVENDGNFLPKDDILKMTLDIINDYRENFAKSDMMYIQGVRKEMIAPDYVPEDETVDSNGKETEEGRTAE
jgi:hypothetical protein